MKHKFKVGDPVYVRYKDGTKTGIHSIMSIINHKNHIKRFGELEAVLLRQESYPYSHHTVSAISLLRKAKFKIPMKKDLKLCREYDILINKKG